mmetsp:Transcript_26103/g.39356  ORF Transcript_26103/g.39356 Transcript_26103/m.39356 type:complete len:242 (+) Transcript_26103:3-728(+)
MAREAPLPGDECPAAAPALAFSPACLMPAAGQPMVYCMPQPHQRPPDALEVAANAPSQRRPVAVHMSPHKYQVLLRSLIDKNFWDYGNGQPPQGETQLLDILWQDLYKKDNSWRLLPESKFGEAQAKGKQFQGGAFLMDRRKFVRTKWEDAGFRSKDRTVTGGDSTKQLNAKRWLVANGILELSQQLFSEERVRGRRADGEAHVGAGPTVERISLIREAGGVGRSFAHGKQARPPPIRRMC